MTMSDHSASNRRTFLRAATVAAVAAPVFAAPAPGGSRVKILGVACSPRRGMTTARAVRIALEAARAVDRQIEGGRIYLGGLKVA